MDPKEILQKFFGYTAFRNGQEEIISSIIRGENVLAVLPTGGGKSICYQIPALLGETFSIVVSPLIALMKDQVDSINRLQTISAFINSSLDYRETEKVLNNLSNGKLKLLYVSPEKLANVNFAERVKALHPSYFFVDEAHCISEWGHNFRPGYRKIKEFIDFTGIKSVSAFTATATEDVRNDIISQLGLINANIFVKGFERENFRLSVIQTTNKKEKLVEILSGGEGSSIIYTSTRKLTEEAADYLRIHGIDAIYYHAGLTTEMRRMIQDDFLSGRINTIVSTNAFGMGIDKSNIRVIVHFNMPGTLENYYQEIGRAGRDGREASIFLLYEERDELIQHYFIENAYPSRDQIEIVYNAVCNRGKIALGKVSENPVIIDKELTQLTDANKISSGILESSIKVLIESGYLKKRSETGNLHTGRFLLDPQKVKSYATEIVSNELGGLIIILAREYGSKIFNSRIQLNLSKLGESLDLTYEQVIARLEELSRLGIMEYSRPTLAPSIWLARGRVRQEELVLDSTKLKLIYNHSKTKLERMSGYVFTDDCRFKYILGYFGQSEKGYRCGKCDNCTGLKQINNSTLAYLEEIIVQTVSASEVPLPESAVLQILTGKSKTSSYRKFSTFGSCSHFSRAELANAVRNLFHRDILLETNGLLSMAPVRNGKEINQTADAITARSNSDFEKTLKLFNILRQIRKEASERFHQEPNMICPDDLLRSIAKIRPKSHPELLEIKGFNQRMFNKIGADFIEVIRESDRSEGLWDSVKYKGLPENIKFIYDLLEKKYSLAEIASISKISESIAAVQIETIITMIPDIEISHLFEKGELKTIFEKIDEGVTGLKDLHFALGKSIGYAKIRIASAKRRVS